MKHDCSSPCGGKQFKAGRHYLFAQVAEHKLFTQATNVKKMSCLSCPLDLPDHINLNRQGPQVRKSSRTTQVATRQVRKKFSINYLRFITDFLVRVHSPSL